MNLKVGHERGGKPCKGVGEMAIEHTSYYVKGDGDYWGQKGTAVCADKGTEERREDRKQPKQGMHETP